MTSNNPYLDPALMAAFANFSPEKNKKFEKKFVVEKPKLTELREQLAEEKRKPVSVASRVDDYEQIDATAKSTDIEPERGSPSTSTLPARERGHKKRISVEIEAGAVSSRVADYQTSNLDEHQSAQSPAATTHATQLSVELEAGRVAQQVAAYGHQEPITITASADPALKLKVEAEAEALAPPKSGMPSFAMDVQDMKMEESANAGDAGMQTTDDEDDESLSIEMPAWAVEGAIVQFTDSPEFLAREWRAAGLGLYDDLNRYVKAVGTIEEVDEDGTVKVQWANGDTNWMPINACTCDMDAEPEPFYSNDIWIYTQFRYGYVKSRPSSQPPQSKRKAPKANTKPKDQQTTAT